LKAENTKLREKVQKLAEALDKALVMIGKQNSGSAASINESGTGNQDEETVSKRELTKQPK
jgi:hypothetical protein